MNAVDLFREEFGEDETDELLGTFPPALRRVLESDTPDEEED